jgi:hypothetical protein
MRKPLILTEKVLLCTTPELLQEIDALLALSPRSQFATRSELLRHLIVLGLAQMTAQSSNKKRKTL